MKTSRWLTVFWMLVLFMPFLVLGIGRSERLTLKLAADRSAARAWARELTLEAQSCALPKDGIAMLFRQFQDRADLILERPGSGVEAKRQNLVRLYANLVRPWLPDHALALKSNLASASDGLRIDVTHGRRFPPGFSDVFLGATWIDSKAPVRSGMEAGLSRLLGSPVNLDAQGWTKNGKLQTFPGTEGINGFYWRAGLNCRLVAWLDLTGLDPYLGMRIMADQVREPGRGFLFTDGGGTPIVGGGEWRSGGVRLIERLRRLGGGSLPSVAVVGRRLVMTSLPPSGMAGRIIVTVPWPAGDGVGFAAGMPSASVSGALGMALLLALLGAAAFIGRRATVGWMLLGACLGMSIVPAGAGWIVVKRAVAEYGRAELRTKINDLHRDLTNLDNGGITLHATMIGGLRGLARNPGTFARLEAERTPSGLRSVLRFLIDRCRLDDYPGLRGPDLLLCISPDDMTSIVSRLTKNSETITSSERPILEVFAPLVKRMRDAMMRNGRVPPPEEGLSEAGKLRETVKADMLYDLYIGIFGIDALISQFTFPEELIDVKTSFLRIFIIGLKVFGAAGIPTEWLLFSIWDDSKELAYVDRFFSERFRGRSSPGQKHIARVAFRSPDDEPDAPEIWSITGLAEHIFGGWVAPEGVELPTTLRDAIERARNSGIIQTGRDMSAPGRPVFEAFLGNHLSRFVLGGQVETNSIERRVRQLQVAGNILAIGLVAAALVLAWFGRRWLLEPLERLRLAMGQVAEGRYDTRIPADRSDEFGTLAVAFNMMARALGEAAILGRFVSGTVRRAVRDRKADESGRGEHREVTVLFSCLFHFDKVCAEKNATEIFDALGMHLGALNTELEPFSAGAEIDKVIGDKILIVFDHERLGGETPAAAAVLAVVNGVRRRMHAAGLETAMGVNTGRVISGILGATSVRLDHTVIGDPVNLASRLALLAHMTEGTRTVLSGAFLAACETPPKAEKLPFRKVKGKTQEVEAWLMLEDVRKKHVRAKKTHAPEK